MKIDEMKIASPFIPFDLWAQGPWALFNIGIEFFQTWQEECFSRLRLVSAEAKSASRPKRQLPTLGCLQNVQVVGGPVAAAQKPVKAAAPVAKKAVAPVAAAESNAATAVESKVATAVAKAPAPSAAAVTVAPVAPAEAAAKVAAAAPEVSSEASSDSATPLAASSAAPMSVTSMLAMQAKSLAKAVTTTQPVVAGKAGKAAPAKAKPAAGKVVASKKA